MFRVGDLVRVKSQIEIESTLDEYYSCDGLEYNDEDMCIFSGHIYKISIVNNDYESPRYSLYPVRFSSYDDYLHSDYEEEDDYVGDFRWVDKWLEPVQITMWEGL